MVPERWALGTSASGSNSRTHLPCWGASRLSRVLWVTMIILGWALSLSFILYPIDLLSHAFRLYL